MTLTVDPNGAITTLFTITSTLPVTELLEKTSQSLSQISEQMTPELIQKIAFEISEQMTPELVRKIAKEVMGITFVSTILTVGMIFCAYQVHSIICADLSRGRHKTQGTLEEEFDGAFYFYPENGEKLIRLKKA